MTAARLLGDAVLVTALGRGTAASVVRHDLEAHGVRVVDLDPTADVPVASCLVTPDGERTVVSPGARTSTVPLTPEAAEAVRSASVLLLDGHHPDAADAALGLATGLRVLDAGSAKPRAERWLPRLDVLAGSADYARGIGRSLDGALAHALDGGAAAAVMTDGAQPCRWRTAGAHGQVDVEHVTVVDTLGAGDAFHGALAAALAAGPDLPGAIALACRVATARVQRQGARAWLADVVPLPDIRPPAH